MTVVNDDLHNKNTEGHAIASCMDCTPLDVSLFESPQVLACSPHICNWLLCEQLTRQQPGKWQPSGSTGDPGISP